MLGLDPDPGRLWPEARAAATDGDPRTAAAAAVEAQCMALIDAAGPACVAVKPQVACFERLGGVGWDVLARVVARARELDLLVVADAKRGDIDVSAVAYGQAFFGGTETEWGDVPGLGVDALTANPYLGRDALAPLVSSARDTGAGVFVLVRTSNPGAAELQDRPLEEGPTVAERVAILVNGLGDGGEGEIADVGAVVGATVPEVLEKMRELMPRAPFLLPGVGAQGGRVEDLAPAWVPGPAAGLIAASRSVARAHEESDEDPPAAARREAERLRELAWEAASDVSAGR